MATYERELNRFFKEFAVFKLINPEERDIFFQMSAASMAFGDAIACLYRREYPAYPAKITASAATVLSYLNDSTPLDTIQEDLLLEYAHAAKKHPGMTLDTGGHDDASAIFAIGEELGEMFAALTYDNAKSTGHGSDFYREAIQYIGLIVQHVTHMASRADFNRPQ